MQFPASQEDLLLFLKFIYLYYKLQPQKKITSFLFNCPLLQRMVLPFLTYTPLLCESNVINFTVCSTSRHKICKFTVFIHCFNFGGIFYSVHFKEQALISGQVFFQHVLINCLNLESLTSQQTQGIRLVSYCLTLVAVTFLQDSKYLNLL